MPTLYRRHLLDMQASPLTKGAVKTCPPCTQECEQGRFCPARLVKAAEMADADFSSDATRAAKARKRVMEDSERSDVPWWIVVLIFALGAPLSALLFRLLHMTGIPG